MVALVRAKFVCRGKEKDPHNDYTNIQLEAVTDGSEENKSFWKYTPSGRLEMSIDNPDAVEHFEVGKEYYLDFTLAE